MGNKSFILNLFYLLGKIIIAILAFFFLIRSFGYFFKPVELLGRYAPVRFALLMHILAGIIGIITGPFLFIESFRLKYPGYHRLVGKLYLVSVKIAALGALILTLTSAKAFGIAYEISLHIEGIAWTISAILAWYFAILKEFEEHRKWVTRNYIIIIAFLIQTTVFRIPEIVNLAPYELMGPTIIWVSWTVPIFAYEILLSLNNVSST